MTTVEDSLVREFVTARRGWGLRRMALRGYLGPTIVGWCDLPDKASDSDYRRKIDEGIRSLPDDELSTEDRLAIRVALALHPGYQHAKLKDRVDRLSEAFTCSERSVRRRIDRAFRQLAQGILIRYDPDGAPNPDKGWAVERLKVLVRLDKPEPELIEERMVVATRDGLRRISARFSVPRRPEGGDGRRELSADIQQGARIIDQRREGDGHFYYLLELPKVLRRGEKHPYTMVFRVLDGQPIRDYYAFVPLVTCESFHVRVRFDSTRLPVSVWRLNRVPPRVLADPVPPGPPLSLDGAGEIAQEFRDVEQGYGYGLGWLPAT